VLLKAAFTAVCVAIVYFRLQSNLFWNLLAAVTIGAAFWRGRWEERSVAAVITLAVLATTTVWFHGAPRARLILPIDAIETVALIVIAVRSNLWWPSWCAAFSVMAVLNHIVFIAAPQAIDLWAYWSGLIIWAWLGLLPLVFGVWDAWAERRVSGLHAPTNPAPADAIRR